MPEDFRLGLIKFGSTAEQVVEPTTDRARMELALRQLNVAGGTAMGDGLKLGLEAAQTPIPDGLGGTRKLPTAIVLLSDGANTRGDDPIDIAQQAKKAKIRIYTVALGTPSGTLEIQRPDGTTRIQKVPPDTLTLQEIARDTGGRYFNAPDADQLEAVYSGLATRFATVQEKQEMTATFAGGGLVLLLGGLAFSLLRGRAAAVSRACASSPRRRSARPSGPAPGPVPPQVLRSLDLAVMRRVESLIPGEHLTPQVGGGTDLATIRRLPAGRRRPPHRLERDRAHAASRTCACTSASAR